MSEKTDIKENAENLKGSEIEQCFDEDLANDLFYNSEDEDDKIKALTMAKPYFSKNKTASKIIMDGAANKYVGDRSAAYAKEVFYFCIKRYIDSIIHQYYNPYVSTGDAAKNREVTESMEAAAMVVLLHELGKFDIEKGAPITFCKVHIINGIKRYLSETRDVKPHYNQQINRVIKAENILKLKGQKPTSEALHELLPGMSLEQISNAIEMRDATERKQDLDSEEAKNISSGYKSPEEEYIIKERDKTMFDAIERLPEDQKAVFALAFGVDLENREATGVELKTIDISKELGIKPEVVNSLKVKAQRQVRYEMLNSGFRNGKTLDVHEESILNEGKVTFAEDESDADVKSYIDSIIEIRVI